MSDVKMWWELEGEEFLHRFWSIMDRLFQSDNERQINILTLMTLYQSGQSQSLFNSPEAIQISRRDPETANYRPWINLVRSVVDTVHAKISGNSPRAAFVTDRGDYQLYKRAKDLEMFTLGVVHRSRGHELTSECFRKAAIIGTGIAKVCSEVSAGTGKIYLEEVLPWEMMLDPTDSYYGCPRNYFEVRLVDRGKLLQMFEGEEEAQAMIRKAPRAVTTELNRNTAVGVLSIDGLADQVLVVEFTRLPSAEGADDGMHGYIVRTGVLVKEPWSRQRTRYVFIHWQKPLRGFWGDSLAEEEKGLHLYVNRLLGKIDTTLHHLSVPWIFRFGNNVPDHHFNNDLKGVIFDIPEGTTPPVVNTHASIPPDLERHFDRIYRMAYEIPGVSQLSASGLKPSGLDAAVALQEYNDIQTERFKPKGKAYEQMFVDLAHAIIDEARWLDKQGVSVEISTESRGTSSSYVKTIKWKDCAMDDDVFQIKVMAASNLPTTPAGRKQWVQDMLPTGLFSNAQLLQVLDIGDVQAAMDQANSTTAIVNQMIENMIEEGIPESPFPEMDLNLTLSMAMLSKVQFKTMKVPGDRLELLQNFIDQTASMLQPPPPPPAPPPGEAELGALPPGGPEGPPPGPPPGPEQAAGLPS